MTKFESAASTSVASSGPSSSSSTDHAMHTFKYTFEDTGITPSALHTHDNGAQAAATTSAPAGGTTSTSGGAAADAGATTSAGSSSSLPGATSGNASSSPSVSSASAVAVDVERTTFRCTAYFPRHFHAVRLMTCGGDYEFIQSLCHCTRWTATGGKSGSTFCKTADDRFILKFITRTELKMFLELAHRYFAYLAKNIFHALPSFLVKILGVYQISWKKHNFKPHTRGGGGSGLGTAGGDAAGSAAASAGGSEGGLASSSSSSSLGGEAVSSLSSQYVLVMPNLFFGRPPESIEKIFDLKGSARNRYVKRKKGEENRVLLDENLMEYTMGYPLPLSDASKTLLRMSVFNDTLFLSNLEIIDYSVIVGLDRKNQKLIVGIIDYIRVYTWDKRLETGVKSVGLIAGQQTPTIISPHNYKQRFRLAMDRYFMSSPDHASKLSMLAVGNNAHNATANDATTAGDKDKALR